MRPSSSSGVPPMCLRIDLSTSGALVEAEPELRVGETVVLLLNDPPPGYNVKAVVRNVRDGGSRFGVEFTEAASEA